MITKPSNILIKVLLREFSCNIGKGIAPNLYNDHQSQIFLGLRAVLLKSNSRKEAILILNNYIGIFNNVEYIKYDDEGNKYIKNYKFN